jgi:hypothetical protein
MCPAPGISQPIAGAMTDMVVSGGLGGAEFFFLSSDEFAIQIITSSR